MFKNKLETHGEASNNKITWKAKEHWHSHKFSSNKNQQIERSYYVEKIFECTAARHRSVHKHNRQMKLKWFLNVMQVLRVKFIALDVVESLMLGEEHSKQWVHEILYKIPNWKHDGMTKGIYSVNYMQLWRNKKFGCWVPHQSILIGRCTHLLAAIRMMQIGHEYKCRWNIVMDVLSIVVGRTFSR